MRCFRPLPDWRFLLGALWMLTITGMASAQEAAVPVLSFDSGEALHSTASETFFSPDNRFLALADDHEIRLYDVATGLVLRRISGEKNYSRVWFSRDFQQLRYTRLPQADDPAPGEGREVARGVFSDSVFFQRPVLAQDRRYLVPLSGRRLLLVNEKGVRLQGRRAADTLALQGARAVLSADERFLLTKPNYLGYPLLVTTVRTRATREANLTHVPRRLLTSGEVADRQAGAMTYQPEYFTWADDSRYLCGVMHSYAHPEDIFRVFDVAADSVVFNHTFKAGTTDAESYQYHPAYFPASQTVTLPQDTDLVVYNLKTGAEVRLPYPGYKFGLSTRVTADGRTLLVWNSALVDVYDLRAGQYVWRSTAGSEVQVHPTAPVAYVSRPARGGHSADDSTLVLHLDGRFSITRRPGAFIKASPDGALIYGKSGFRYALFDENMTLLRYLNTCTPTASVQPTANPALLLTGELGTCSFANNEAAGNPDFQVWNLQRMELLPVQLPTDRVAELATLDGLSPFEDDLLYNEGGRPRLLLDSARLGNACPGCGELQAISGRYALFRKEASLAGLLDPGLTPEKDTLTLVTDFGPARVVLGAANSVRLATLAEGAHEIYAIGESLTADAAVYFTVWDFNGKKRRELRLSLPKECDLVGGAGHLEVTPGGKFAVITTNSYRPELSRQAPQQWFIDLANGRYLGQAEGAANACALSEPHGQLLTLADQGAAHRATIRQLAGWKKLRETTLNCVALRGELLLGFWATTTAGRDPYAAMFYPTGPSRLALLNWATGDTLYRQTVRNDLITAGDISPDGRWLAYADNANRIHLVRVAGPPAGASLRGHASTVVALKFTADGERLVSSGTDGTVRVWSVAKQAEIGALVSLGPGNYLATTPQGYYRCSKNAVGKFGYRLGEHAYAGEQFDLRFNRPDKVLQAFGADSALVQGYRAAWQKRVRRAGFSPQQLAGTAPVPTLELLNRAALPYATAQPRLSCDLLLADSLALLDRLNVWVNGVAVFGKHGLPQRTKNAHRLRLTVPVALQAGPNRVEFSAQNAQGVESYRTTFLVNRTSPPAAPGQVYFVGIGVSRFANARYNLQYAAKDIRDLARAVRRRYPTAHIDTLLDARVTRANVLALRKKLLATGLEDRVLLSVAGHGLLDKQFAFYYATHDMDFADPARHGVLYDDLEGLLDSIPARRRLLLLDACHSGEIDRDAAPVPAPGAAPGAGPVRAVVASAARGVVEVSTPVVGLQNSFALMQDLFADLSRGTGTQVIAAAAGNSYAYELRSLRNGVFTHCVLDYLAHQPAGSVRVNALRESVAARVAALTRGAQKPSARAANNGFDWEVW